MMKLEVLKSNETNFQNNKYSFTPEHLRNKAYSTIEYENIFLTPYHKGGYFRGYHFGETVSEMLNDGGNLKGKRILDYCCGRGDLALYLAQKGAIVSAFDISDEAIKVAKMKGISNNISVDFQSMDAEKLKYEDNYFDYVIAFEALHHVILYPNTLHELKRVMKPSSIAVMAENWGGDNFIFQTYRNNTTFKKSQAHERGEVILSKSLLEKYRIPGLFHSVRPLSMTYMLKKFIKSKKISSILFRIDSMLFRLFPFMRNFAGEAIVTFKKSSE